jgi:glycosyltransferase involved in cell wall biosynthesis
MEELADALWASGGVEAITVLAPDLPGGAPRRERDPSGTVIIRYPARDVIPNFPVPDALSRGFGGALRAAAATRPDLVVGHTRFFVSSAVALVQARALGVPYVHVEHGSDYVQLDARLPSLAARAYDTGIGRQVLRRADVRLAISAAAGAFVRRLAGVDASVVYRGLPLDRLDAARPAPEASAFAAGRTLVVYVGRLIDGKGVGDLVSAMAQLGDHVCCAVIGDGPRGPSSAAGPRRSRRAAGASRATSPRTTRWRGSVPRTSW